MKSRETMIRTARHLQSAARENYLQSTDPARADAGFLINGAAQALLWAAGVAPTEEEDLFSILDAAEEKSAANEN